MPPGASSFPASENSSQEVVCPLRNQDHSQCRKRCLGEKRYRSMQEHIRRAHPEYYIPKLPATKDSFELMISSTPHERPAQDPNRAPQNNSHHLSQQPPHHLTQVQQPHHQHHHSDPSGVSSAFNFAAGLNSSYQGYALSGHDGGYFTATDTEAAAALFNSMHAQQRPADQYRRGSIIPVASAAAVLAGLHYTRPDPDWGGGDNTAQVTFPSLIDLSSPTSTEADYLQTFYANTDDLKANHFHVDPALEDPGFITDHEAFPVTSTEDQPALLPSSMARSPPDRSSTLAPLQRSLSRGGPLNRPRKSSLSQQARIMKHERKRSRELAKRVSGDRNRFGSENSTLGNGKRWEDLIDAAASATEEEGSRDLTPIPGSPYQSPQVGLRTTVGPFNLQLGSYQASPLQRAMTPPSADTNLDLQTFPSVDSSLSSNLSHHQHHDSTGSGSQFHIMNPSSMDSSSPHFTGTTSNGNVSPVQIYCSGCRHLSILKDSFACTNCIVGLCAQCVDAIVSEHQRGRMSLCPRCNTMSAFKPFQLDLR